jgi:hypothetical protein
MKSEFGFDYLSETKTKMSSEFLRRELSNSGFDLSLWYIIIDQI